MGESGGESGGRRRKGEKGRDLGIYLP